MAINSRTKGKNGELEWSHKCREHGYETRRGQQYSGVNGDADVVGMRGIHFEVKRVEKLNIYDAMDQADSDKREHETPIVAHRKNRKDWLVTMRAEDWFKLYCCAQSGDPRFEDIYLRKTGGWENEHNQED